ncbi:MAG TPA: hypothetical protein VF771_10165 [Longimicrobiaceae bacterium]
MPTFYDFPTRHRTLARFLSLLLLVGSLAALGYTFSVEDIDEVNIYAHLASGIAGFLMLAGCIALYAATNPVVETPGTNPVLAEWTLAPDEWRAFSELEAANIRGNVVWTTFFLGLIGLMLGLIPSGGRLDYGAIGAVLLGVPGYVAVRTAAHLRRTRAPRAGARVVVRRDTVEIDGRREVVHSRSRWIHQMGLRRDLPLPVVMVTTRYESTENFKPVTRNHVFYIPIPRGRETEAEEAVREWVQRRALEAR